MLENLSDIGYELQYRYNEDDFPDMPDHPERPWPDDPDDDEDSC